MTYSIGLAQMERSGSIWYSESADSPYKPTDWDTDLNLGDLIELGNGAAVMQWYNDDRRRLQVMGEKCCGSLALVCCVLFSLLTYKM